MLVSAITMHNYNGYNATNEKTARAKDVIGDTSFNSLTPYVTKKSASQERMQQLQMFDNINEWQKFCHKQILGGKLDIIA